MKELLEQPLCKAERVARFRALVERQEELPDDLLEIALLKLMERLTE